MSFNQLFKSEIKLTNAGVQNTAETQLPKAELH